MTTTGPPENFDEWLTKYGEPYQAAVIANDAEPWSVDMDERRALWERRHTRPDPPEGLQRDPRKPQHRIDHPQEISA